MWWPSGGFTSTWLEAHNSPGVTATGTLWGLADGEQGGTRSSDTYILVANTSAFAGAVQMTLLFDDGTIGTCGGGRDPGQQPHDLLHGRLQRDPEPEVRGAGRESPDGGRDGADCRRAGDVLDRQRDLVGGRDQTRWRQSSDDVPITLTLADEASSG